MNEIKFSVYGGQLSLLTNTDFLFKQFEAQHNAKVLTEYMPWEDAWSKLLNFALHGGGPHVSIIGAIWTSSLMSMNTLRQFKPQEIASLGGSDVYFPSTWGNAVFTPKKQVWAMPFNAYTYLILYRRDLLEKAGVDEKTAFSSPAAMLTTLEKLKEAGVSSPIVLPSGKPFLSRVHIASSWIWESGGDYVSSDGKQVLLMQDEVLDGLSAFYKLYRYLDPNDYGLTQPECQQRFADGKAAMVIAGSTSQGTMRDAPVQTVLNNLGVAPVPGIPWIAGANLVIWREAQLTYQHEQLALALTRFLTSTESQVICAEAIDAVPVRIEAFERLSFTPAVFKPAIGQSLRTGRTYAPLPVWTRMMNELRSTLDLITTDYLEDPGSDPRTHIVRHLEPLAVRFGFFLTSLR